MVMYPQVVCDAVEAHAEPGMRRVYLSPRGRAFTQRVAEEYAAAGSLLLLCGHHAKNQVWRRQKQLERTNRKRLDLLEKAELDKKDRAYLKKLSEAEAEK